MFWSVRIGTDTPENIAEPTVCAEAAPAVIVTAKPAISATAFSLNAPSPTIITLSIAPAGSSADSTYG